MKLFVSKNENSGRIGVKPTKTIVTYEIEAVTYTSTFEVDWVNMKEDDKVAFRTVFIQATADALVGVSPDDIIIHGITAGSAIVDASIYIAEGSTVTTDSIETKLTTATSPISVTLSDGVRVDATVSNLKTGFVSIMGEKPKKLAEPHKLTARNISADSIELIWTDEDNGDATVLKYLIFKNNILIDEVSADVFTYTVVGLENNIHYTFNVRKETNLTNVDSIVSITFGGTIYTETNNWNVYPFKNARGGSFWTSGSNSSNGWVLQSEYTLEEVLALATVDVGFVIKAGDGSNPMDRYYFRLADGRNALEDGVYYANFITYENTDDTL
jgi:hypothetical protein